VRSTARGVRDGWVACRYLSDTGRGGIVIGGDGRRTSASASRFRASASSSASPASTAGRPPRPSGLRDRVCFYEHVNYGGASFCARPGERISSLGSWNDRISSIRVLGDAEALVCEHNNFRGRCVVIDRSVRNLGPRGNDIISSIRVR
jgi:hypothetical protein